MVDWSKLDEANLGLKPGEVSMATSWADGLTDEEVNEIHNKFKEIAAAEDKKKAILDDVLFFVHLAKAVLTGV